MNLRICNHIVTSEISSLTIITITAVFHSHRMDTSKTFQNTNTTRHRKSIAKMPYKGQQTQNVIRSPLTTTSIQLITISSRSSPATTTGHHSLIALLPDSLLTVIDRSHPYQPTVR